MIIESKKLRPDQKEELIRLLQDQSVITKDIENKILKSDNLQSWFDATDLQRKEYFIRKRYSELISRCKQDLNGHTIPLFERKKGKYVKRSDTNKYFAKNLLRVLRQACTFSKFWPELSRKITPLIDEVITKYPYVEKS